MRFGYRIVLTLLATTVAGCGPHAEHVRTVAPPEPARSLPPDTLAADLDAVDAYLADEAVRGYLEALWQAAQAPAPRRTPVSTPVRPQPAPKAHGRCGGPLPPCWVLARESRGDIRAENPHSTASGKWQFLRGTWARFGGYLTAGAAPEAVQDAKAIQVWAGGRGCAHWSAC